MALSDHPTAADRVQHFLATVSDYERLNVAMPIGRSINLLGHSDEAERWKVVTHALLLRKYFAKTDNLYLTEVVRAARACVVGEDLPARTWNEMEQNVAVMQGGFGSSFGDSPKVYQDDELLMAQLYGRFLHGDFGKWQTSEMAGDRGSDTAVFHATVNRADRVLKLARWLRQGAEEGHLAY
ncbi:hypothetical protein [Curtobacterium luteum]|nr:hypothetical protein [Curtobacterium luteum]